MQRNVSNHLKRLAAALAVALAALGAAAPAQAEDVAGGCVATQADPHCTFTCPAYGVVKVTIDGPGDDGWIQGGIACGTPPGDSGYIKGMAVSCREDGGATWVYEEVMDLVWHTVTAPLDDGQCSARMTNDGDGPLGQCWLNAGVRAVCIVEHEGRLSGI